MIETNGITINGKHSYRDFGLIDQGKSHSTGTPSPNTVEESVPFRNGSYDFSAVLGYMTYANRKVEFTWKKIVGDYTEAEAVKGEILRWLYSAVNTEMRDDRLPGWYYKVVNTSVTYTQSKRIVTVKATFNCYPFRFADRLTRATTKTGVPALIFNNGEPVSMTATATEDCTITSGDYSATLTAGEATELPFPLFAGANRVTTTNGTVTLVWREARL